MSDVIDDVGYVKSIIFNLKNTNKDIYPYNLEVIKNLETLNFHEKVTFIVGENGTGKSTLIEAIAVAFGFNAEGGSINFNFSTKNSTSELYKNVKINKTLKKPKDGYFLRAESFYNVASYIDAIDELPAASRKIIESYGGKSLHTQSHGESFFSLFLNRFNGNGFYILDEPEAALSAERQLAFVSRLNDLVMMGSQFIIATHSPIILSYPYSDIYQITESGLHQTEYENTEQYKFMNFFMNNYRQIIDKLIFD